MKLPRLDQNDPRDRELLAEAHDLFVSMGEMLADARERVTVEEAVLELAALFCESDPGTAERRQVEGGKVRVTVTVSRAELRKTVPLVLRYLVLATRLPDPALREIAEWALAELGTSRDELLAHGQECRFTRELVERIVAAC